MVQKGIGHLAQSMQASAWVRWSSRLVLLLVALTLLLQLNSRPASADAGKYKGCPVNVGTSRLLTRDHPAMKQVISVTGPNCTLSVEESEISLAEAEATPVIPEGVQTASIRLNLMPNNATSMTSSTTSTAHTKQVQVDVVGVLLTGIQHDTSFSWDGWNVTSLNWMNLTYWYHYSTGWRYLGSWQNVSVPAGGTYAETAAGATFDWTNADYYNHSFTNVNGVRGSGAFSPQFYFSGSICSDLGCSIQRTAWLD